MKKRRPKEEKQSRVKQAMQEIENRKAGDWMRWSAGNMQNVLDVKQSNNTSRPIIDNTYLQKAPTWYSPAKETEDPIIEAGREYGTNILEDNFNQGWIFMPRQSLYA